MDQTADVRRLFHIAPHARIVLAFGTQMDQAEDINFHEQLDRDKLSGAAAEEDKGYFITQCYLDI